MVDGLTPSDMGLFLVHLNGRPSGRVKAVDQVNPLHTGLLCFRMRVGRFLL